MTDPGPAVPAANPSDLAFATELARIAGDSTLKWFQNPDLDVGHKTDGTPVTRADLAAETLVREQLRSAFGDDAVMGEEHHDESGTTGRTWIVDPIDGTKAFARGVPLYATLIALVDEHGPAVGVIYLPALGEVVAAGRGRGATVNDRPCAVSTTRLLEEAYVMTSGFGYWPDAALQRLHQSPATVRTWGDAYGYALVATGRADAMIDPQANPWDLAPMSVIITEAGGKFSAASGDVGSDTWARGSGVASNGHIHDNLIERVQPY